jgi:hypothetical protein
MRPGSDILLQIVVAKLAVVKTVGYCLDRIHLFSCVPLDIYCAGRLTAWVILPKGDVSAAIYPGLNCPLIINLRGRQNSFMTIVIEAIEERVTGHEIVRRQLRFDIWLGYDSANSNVHSLKNVWNVEIEINHRHVEAGVAVVFQQLIAEKPVGRCEPVIEPIER